MRPDLFFILSTGKPAGVVADQTRHSNGVLAERHRPGRPRQSFLRTKACAIESPAHCT